MCRVAFKILPSIHDGAPLQKQPTASTSWLFSEYKAPPQMFGSTPNTPPIGRLEVLKMWEVGGLEVNGICNWRLLYSELIEARSEWIWRVNNASLLNWFFFYWQYKATSLYILYPERSLELITWFSSFNILSPFTGQPYLSLNLLLYCPFISHLSPLLASTSSLLISSFSLFVNSFDL